VVVLICSSSARAPRLQIVQDLSVLRQLMDYLLRYDAVTFYNFLLCLQKANSTQR
jgi:hypothetical protein